VARRPPRPGDGARSRWPRSLGGDRRAGRQRGPARARRYAAALRPARRLEPRRPRRGGPAGPPSDPRPRSAPPPRHRPASVDVAVGALMAAAPVPPMDRPGVPRERRWLPVVIVTALLAVVAFGARSVADATTTDTGPLTMGSVRIQPQPGWQVEGS